MDGVKICRNDHLQLGRLDSIFDSLAVEVGEVLLLPLPATTESRGKSRRILTMLATISGDFKELIHASGSGAKSLAPWSPTKPILWSREARQPYKQALCKFMKFII